MDADDSVSFVEGDALEFAISGESCERLVVVSPEQVSRFSRSVTNRMVV